MYYMIGGELYHHGVLGQKWGKRNGPPYPLNSSVSTGHRLKAEEGGSSTKKKSSGGGIGGYIKNKKRAKQRKKALEKARAVRAANAEEKRKQEEFDKNKQKIMQFSSDTNKGARNVAANASRMTNQEIQDMANRLRNMDEINRHIVKEPTKWERTQKKIDNIMDTVDWSRDKIEKGIKAYNTIARIVNSLDDSDKPSMPIIRDAKDFIKKAADQEIKIKEKNSRGENNMKNTSNKTERKQKEKDERKQQKAQLKQDEKQLKQDEKQLKQDKRELKKEQKQEAKQTKSEERQEQKQKPTRNRPVVSYTKSTNNDYESYSKAQEEKYERERVERAAARANPPRPKSGESYSDYNKRMDKYYKKYYPYVFR